MAPESIRKRLAALGPIPVQQEERKKLPGLGTGQVGQTLPATVHAHAPEEVHLDTIFAGLQLRACPGARGRSLRPANATARRALRGQPSRAARPSHGRPAAGVPRLGGGALARDLHLPPKYRSAPRKTANPGPRLEGASIQAPQESEGLTPCPTPCLQNGSHDTNKLRQSATYSHCTTVSSDWRPSSAPTRGTAWQLPHARRQRDAGEIELRDKQGSDGVSR